MIPLFADEDVVPVAEDTQVTGNLLGNDSDLDGPALTVTEFSIDGITYPAGTTVSLPEGTLVINLDGSFTFTPAPDYTGLVPVATYTVSDGTLTDTATLTLGPITPINDAPVVADDVAQTDQEQPIELNVLTNDHDVDGDALTVVFAASPNGTITINPDGTLSFQPAPGFSGSTTVTYTVSDGHGGFATAIVTIHVRPAVSVPMVVTEPPSVTNAPTLSVESLMVDGAILDAVSSISNLNSLAGQIGERGVVVAAANQASSLNGIAANGYISVVGRPVPLHEPRIWAIEQALRSSGYHRDADLWDVQGLTGFSLRLGLLGSEDGASTRSQVIIESLVRDRTLIVQISSSVQDAGRAVQEYRFTQANGQPLPGWLDRAGASLLIGQRPANIESIDLRVTVIYTDGTFEEKAVRIETMSGDIKPVALQRGASLGRPIWEQFAVIERVTEEGTRELAELLRE